jgi:thiol-disulfide isomerase/thioredoxin
MSVLDRLKVTVVSRSRDVVSLSDLRDGKAMVLDFWHTKCVKCPAALEKLNDEAEEKEDILFVACALSQGQGNIEAVEELTQDWLHLTHTFMEMDAKEEAKGAFGFTSVPFFVVIAQDGTILGTGDPKKISYESLFEQPLSSTSKETGKDVFSLDEDF